jgi:Flp pilus assembly protein TadG
MIRRGLGDDRGSVVAEFAVALPAVAIVVLLGAGALGACATQVRLQDAAADAARLAARGEPDGRARSVVAAAVPGADTVLARRGDLVCVTASASAATSVPIALTATSCALDGGL